MLDDAPQAQVLVLRASDARLTTEQLLLPGGGGAEVIEDEDGDQLVQVTSGRVLPDELVRSLLRSADFSPRGGLIDLVVVTDTGWDRYVLPEDLGSRLLHARRDDASMGAGALHVAVIGPPASDPLAARTPSAAAQAALTLVGRGSRDVGQLTELPLAEAPAAAGIGGRRAEVLADADLVVASWGHVTGAAEAAAEEAVETLRAHREDGGVVLVRTRAGQPDSVGADGHPSARAEVRADDDLLPAPKDWLWGAPLA